MQLHRLHVGDAWQEHSAFSTCSIKVMPWCTECWTVRTHCQSEGGMTMWSL